jgi:hypothetical protein
VSADKWVGRLINETRIYFLKGIKMNTKKREDLMNEKINPQAEELADLPVADEQARQAKGGQIDSSDVEYKYVPVRRSY